MLQSWPVIIVGWVNIGEIHLTFRSFWWEYSGISRALEVSFESLAKAPCPLDSDYEDEASNLGNGYAGWGWGQEGTANDSCILSTCLGIFVEIMQSVSLSCADCTHKLDLRRGPQLLKTMVPDMAQPRWLLPVGSLLAGCSTLEAFELPTRSHSTDKCHCLHGA